jgi:large subunit ribosomal protein L35
MLPSFDGRTHFSHATHAKCGIFRSRHDHALEHIKTESKMPKMKTKSSAKKRFKITATGKVKVAAAGKQHGMIKRSNKFIRDARGTMVLSEPDAKIVKKMMPYGS